MWGFGLRAWKISILVCFASAFPSDGYALSLDYGDIKGAISETLDTSFDFVSNVAEVPSVFTVVKYGLDVEKRSAEQNINRKDAAKEQAAITGVGVLGGVVVGGACLLTGYGAVFTAGCSTAGSYVASKGMSHIIDSPREAIRQSNRDFAALVDYAKDAEFRRKMASMPTSFTTTSPDRVVKTNRVVPADVETDFRDIGPTIADIPIPIARPKIEDTPTAREPRAKTGTQVAGGGVNLDVLNQPASKRSSGGVDLDVLSSPKKQSGGKQSGRKKECNGIGGINLVWCYAEMGPYSKYGNILSGVTSGQVSCSEARSYFKRALAGARSAPASSSDKESVKYALEAQEIAVGHFCGW